MNVFLDLLKKNKILPNLDFSRDSIAKTLLGTPVVSPVQQSPIEKAVDVAKTLGAYTAAQVATDVPKAIGASLQLSPLAQLGHSFNMATGNTSPVENAKQQLGLAGQALAPVGYLTNPIAAAGAGGGNIALQQALSMIRGENSPNYGESFANGVNASGPGLALGPVLQMLMSKVPNTTRYVGDPLPPDNTQWIQKGERLIRDQRYGPRGKWVGK